MRFVSFRYGTPTPRVGVQLGDLVIDISAAGPTVGVALLLWGVLTLYLWVGTFRLPKILFLIFLTLWVTFGLLGLGTLGSNPGLTHAGGWLGVLCGSLAMYGSFGIVTNGVFGRALVPLGEQPVLAR